MGMEWLGGVIDFAKDMFSEQTTRNAQEDAQIFNANEAGINREFNASQAREAREFNSAQAVAQREWTERMDNTKIRRLHADLTAAGLNPLLAYHMGAQAPAGASASGQAASGQAASSSALGWRPSTSVAAGMQAASQIEMNSALKERTLAEADEIRERTKNYDPQRREIEARIPVHQEQVNEIKQRIGESAVRIEKIWEEVSHVKASAANIAQQTTNLQATIPLIRAQITQLKALAAKESAETAEIKQRINADLPGLERTLGNLETLAMQMAQPQHANKERAADSFAGQLGAYLREINPLQGFIGITPGRRSVNIHNYGGRR